MEAEERHATTVSCEAHAPEHIIPWEQHDEEVPPDECGSRFVMLECNKLRWLWTVVVLVLILYTATVFLYRLCFCTFRISEEGDDPIGGEDASWIAIDWCVDVLFWVDLVASFFLSYRDDMGQEVVSMRRIACNYLWGRFWLDLFACIPEQLAQVVIRAVSDRATSSGMNRIVRVARVQRISRLARLARLTRLGKLMSTAKLFSAGPWWMWFQSLRGVRVITFVVGLVWISHLLACFWYLCAALHKDPKDTWVGRRTVDRTGTSLLNQGPFEQWLVSMYFILTVFTTVGFGDISAGTEAEILSVAFAMVVGAVVHSIIISEVISIVTSNDHVQEYVKKNEKMIDAFAGHAMLNKQAWRRMKFEVSWRSKTAARHQKFDKDEMSELLNGNLIPTPLLKEMSEALFQGHLMTNDFLRCCHNVYMPPRLPMLLACYLSRAEFKASEIIYQMQDFPFNMFLVLNGTFAHVARPSVHGGVDATEVIVDSHMSRSEGMMTRTLSTFSESTMRVQRSKLYPYRLFGHRSYFGELELFANVSRRSTARCEVPGTLLALHKADLLQLEDQFPQFRSVWSVRARWREGARARARGRLTRALPVRQRAARVIQVAWRELIEEHGGPRRLSGSRESFFDYVQQSANLELGADAGLMGMSKVDPSLQALEMTEQLRKSVESLQADVKALRREVRRALPDYVSVATPAREDSEPPDVDMMTRSRQHPAPSWPVLAPDGTCRHF